MLNVIFDLDGTLVDSVADLQVAVARALEEEGEPPLELATIRAFIGNGAPRLIKRVMQHRFGRVDPQRHQDLLRRFMHHYETAPTARTELYPFVAECLRELAFKGHQLALCTNKPSAISQRILEELGIAAHFSAIVGGDTLPVKKPDPAPLRAAAAALGKRSTLYVGDSEIDSETAERAGLPFLLFTEGYRKRPLSEIPHLHSFDDFQRLPGMIAAWTDEQRQAPLPV